MSLQSEIIKQSLDLAKHIGYKANRKCQLSPLQLRTLMYVRERECVKPTELAREFNVTPATITAQIDKLVAKDWLTRCSDSDDRRVVNISLAQKAKNELDNMIDDTLKEYNWIFKVLSQDEQKQLLSLLKKITENAYVTKKKNE